MRQPGQDGDQGGLAGAVGPEQAEELAVLDGTCGNFAYVKNASGRIGWVPRNVVDAE